MAFDFEVFKKNHTVVFEDLLIVNPFATLTNKLEKVKDKVKDDGIWRRVTDFAATTLSGAFNILIYSFFLYFMYCLLVVTVHWFISVPVIYVIKECQRQRSGKGSGAMQDSRPSNSVKDNPVSRIIGGICLACIVVILASVLDDTAVTDKMNKEEKAENTEKETKTCKYPIHKDQDTTATADVKMKMKRNKTSKSSKCSIS